RFVPKAVSTILTLSLPCEGCLSRTTRSISRCDVTPTCFRNLRRDMLNLSSSMGSLLASTIGLGAAAMLTRTGDNEARLAGKHRSPVRAQRPCLRSAPAVENSRDGDAGAQGAVRPLHQ